MNLKRPATSALLLLLALCATSPSFATNPPTSSYEAKRNADGSVDISLTAKSERLQGLAGRIDFDVVGMLEEAAEKECGEAFDLDIARPRSAIRAGRIVTKVQAVARCK